MVDETDPTLAALAELEAQRERQARTYSWLLGVPLAGSDQSQLQLLMNTLRQRAELNEESQPEDHR